jgi:hypothetical protein
MTTHGFQTSLQGTFEHTKVSMEHFSKHSSPSCTQHRPVKQRCLSGHRAGRETTLLLPALLFPILILLLFFPPKLLPTLFYFLWVLWASSCELGFDRWHLVKRRFFPITQILPLEVTTRKKASVRRVQQMTGNCLVVIDTKLVGHQG